MNDELRLYILVRNDLESMTPGRVAAQASHAANVFIKSKLFPTRKIREWENQTPQGFGTTIVLAASKSQIDTALFKAGLEGKYGEWVTDPE